MRRLLVNGKVLKVYDSIDELPIVNFQKYNKYLLIDAGIGSDVDSIDEHISRIAKLVRVDTAKAMQELQNMRQNMYMITSEISPKYMAFAALIYSIDGRVVSDLSDENLKSILNELRAVKHYWIIDFLAGFKKKVETELDLYFPEDFNNAKQKEAYDRVKRRTTLVLDAIIHGSDNSSEIEQIDSFLISMHKPSSFAGSNSAEIRYDKQFENGCLLIAERVGLDAKAMTTLQFYNAMNVIKKQIENEQKSLAKRRKRAY